MEEIVNLISELLDCLPDSGKWEHDETWKWCWDELSDEAQGKVALVRRKAIILLLEMGKRIVKAQEGTDDNGNTETSATGCGGAG